MRPKQKAASLQPNCHDQVVRASLSGEVRQDGTTFAAPKLALDLPVAGELVLPPAIVLRDFPKKTNEVLVFGLRYRHNQGPTTVLEKLSTPEGKFILAAAGSLFGVPPDVISTATAALSPVNFPHQADGEAQWGWADIPEGYVYCVTTRYGTQSRTINARMRLFLDYDERVIHWSSYARREGVLSGGNYVHRDFAIILVRSDARDDYNCIDPPKDRWARPVIFDAPGGRTLRHNATIVVWEPPA